MARGSAWRWAIVIFLGAALLGAAAVPSGHGAESREDGDGTTLRVAVTGPLWTVDPFLTTAHLIRDHGYMVYDTLFAADATLTPRHQMLAGHTVSEDGLVYRFVLRDGLRFHDGTPVRAADAIASLRRWGALDRLGRELMAVTEGLSEIDEKTFELRLARPYGRVVESLAAPGAHVPFILPARLIGDDPAAPVGEVVGSGPFRFVAGEWIPGSVVVYERFDGYLPREEPARFTAGAKTAHVDRVEWHVFRDPERAIQAMVLGTVDYWPRPPSSAWAALEAAPGILLEVVDPLGYQGWIRPNQRRAPFDTVEGRQALAHVVAAASIGPVTGIDSATWIDCAALFGCGTPLAGAARPAHDGDLAAARRLFAAAGYDGEALVVLDPVDVPVLHAAAGALAATLAQAGATVDLQETDWSGIADRRRGSDWHLFPTVWSVIDIAEPGRHPGLGSAGEAELAGGVEAPEISAGLAALMEAGRPDRRALVAALERAAWSHVPYVIFGQWQEPAARRPEVSGILPSPLPLFWHLRKEP